jgi:hypothetical protein
MAFSSEVDTGSREENASKQEPNLKPGPDSIRTDQALVRLDGGPNYSTASLFALLCAASRSITARHPGLRSLRCLTIHAVMRGMLGISELHRRNASPLHICCASTVKAKPELGDNAETDIANASAKPARRIA